MPYLISGEYAQEFVLCLIPEIMNTETYAEDSKKILAIKRYLLNGNI